MRDAWVQELWTSDTLGMQVARAALAPAELVFTLASATRSLLYDAGILPTRATAVPALSVGNLTVGGTGKTPLAAYFAHRLREAGGRPAIVLRGYGGDESLVHRTINPDIPVIVAHDRIAGSRQARDAGCDVVVFDDAFQHRRAARVADVVLVSADDPWRRRRHLLPAGPWRERLTSARRAALVIVTRKAASAQDADAVALDVARVGVATAQVHLASDRLRRVGDGGGVDHLRPGERVLAVSGIGNPRAFHRQLEAQGAKLSTVTFADHHAYTAAEAYRLAAQAVDFDRVVCTLKDAVKLGALWPGQTALWYVSQRVDVERGAEALDGVITRTLLARSLSNPQ